MLSKALGAGQVFDVGEDKPGKVLKTLWKNLKSTATDPIASNILCNLRILVAGGDGTVVWVLGEIAKLGLTPAPAVAVMPLGTGNDLALSFGWGNKFLPGLINQPTSLYKTLKTYADAQVRVLDHWQVTIEAPSDKYFDITPHSLGAVDAEITHTMEGKFWNYFSIGLDAEAAFGFHSLRENKPWLASRRFLNQAWYSWFSCTSGWFCGAPPLTHSLKLRVKGGTSAGWREVEIPSTVRAIVLLNLQSYGGGRDIWGLACTSNLVKKGMQEPIFDDGMIEVVGFHSGWHTAAVMGQFSPRLHAKRLAQCKEIDIELAAYGKGSSAKKKSMTHMQIDGEPWAQQIPYLEEEGNGQPLKVTVACSGKSKMLFNSASPLGGLHVKKLVKRAAGMTGGQIGNVKMSKERDGR